MRQLLQIQQVPIRLDYSYPLGRQSIRQPKAELEISRQSSELSVKNDPVRLIIDQTRSFEAMNKYKPVSFSYKTAGEAKDIVMQTIAQISDDAKAMTDSRGEAHVEICKRKMGEYSLETVTAFIPVAPDIYWEGGSPTEVDFTPFRLNIDWRVNLKPDISYEPAKFDFKVAQWNKVEIAYTGTYDDIVSIGRHIRQKI